MTQKDFLHFLGHDKELMDLTKFYGEFNTLIDRILRMI